MLSEDANAFLIPDRAVPLSRRCGTYATIELRAGLPEAAAAAAEVAELVLSGLNTPDPIANFHPLELAALHVQEDLVVLIRSEGTWRFGAGVVCFPSHWVPVEKVGLPITEVHEPVPHYKDESGPRLDRFLDHLAPVATCSPFAWLRGVPWSSGSGQRVNVIWVMPLGVLIASMVNWRSSPSSPSQRRTPRPRTIGAITRCMWSINSASRN